MLLLQGHPSAVTTLAFSPDGSQLLAGYESGALELWHGDERNYEFPLGLLTNGPVTSVDFHPIEGLAVGSTNGWKTTFDTQATIKTSAGAVQSSARTPRTKPVAGLKFLDETTLAVGIGDRVRQAAGSFSLWNIKTGAQRKPTFDSPYGVRSVAVARGHKLCAWAEHSSRVTVWQITQPEPWRLHTGKWLTALALSPLGDQIAVATGWETKLYETGQKNPLYKLDGPRGKVTTLEYSPDGRHLAMGSWDGTVRLWDANTGHEIACFDWPIGKTSTVVFAPDGLRLAAAGQNGAICIFDLE